MGRPKMTPEEFWDKVDKSQGPDSCWPWTGCIGTHGYGVTSFSKKQTRVHRAAYALSKGEIPDGLFVCHNCDNPPCCNPKHLFLGTSSENTNDMVSKRRQSRGAKHAAAILPGRKRGSENCLAKLEENQVVEMRRLRSQGMKIRDIADKFKMSYQGAYKAIRGKSWNHLGEPIPTPKHFAKYSDETVRAIRAMRESGVTIKQISHHFGVSVWTCNNIIYERTRRNCPPSP